jgi:hypothetical protein
MFTVTHAGLSKDFDSVYIAMRYALKHWQHNATIWTEDRPLWQASQWVNKKQAAKAKKAW